MIYGNRPVNLNLIKNTIYMSTTVLMLQTKHLYLEICPKENLNDNINGHELYLRLLSEGIKKADQCNVINRPIRFSSPSKIGLNSANSKRSPVTVQFFVIHFKLEAV